MGMKSVAKSLAQRLGYEVYRLAPPDPPEDKSAVVPVQIGPYRIMMCANGTLHRTLAENPDYSGELRRIVALAVGKYPDLAVIDVGANFGDTAAITKLGADIPVLCLEGDPRAYALLTQNIRQLSGVTARNVLLGERVEEMSVSFQKEGWNLTVVPQDGAAAHGGAAPATKVSITTLDECTRDLPDVQRYRVLKVDAEGFDCRIIRGGLRYIERVRPVIMMEYNRENMAQIGEPGLDTLFRLRDAGYRDVLYYDQSGRLLLTTTLDQEVLVRDLHEYADEHARSIYYMDLCLFHADDADLAATFARAEREHRRGEPPPSRA